MMKQIIKYVSSMKNIYPHAVSSTENAEAMQTWTGQVDKNFQTKLLKFFILGQNFSENFCPRIKNFRIFLNFFVLQILFG